MSPIASRRRRGAVLIETAIVLPVFLFFILALVVGGVGIFKYQEVCFVAREGARYAAVHGADYAKEGQKNSVGKQDIFDKGMKPRMVLLDPAKVTWDVTWAKNSNVVSVVTSDYTKAEGNTVTVTVSYQWFPEMYLVGPFTLSGSSTLPMAY